MGRRGRVCPLPRLRRWISRGDAGGGRDPLRRRVRPSARRRQHRSCSRNGLRRREAGPLAARGVGSEAPAPALDAPPPPAPPLRIELSEQPLVTAIMPTADRRRFIPHAIRHFQKQDCPAASSSSSMTARIRERHRPRRSVHSLPALAFQADGGVEAQLCLPRGARRGDHPLGR